MLSLIICNTIIVCGKAQIVTRNYQKSWSIGPTMGDGRGLSPQNFSPSGAYEY